MKFRVSGLTIIAALSVAGCQPTPEQQALENQQDAAQCRSLGAKPGTETMVQCRLALYQARAHERAEQNQRARDVLGAVGGAMMVAGSQPRYVAPSTSITCTTFLNTTRCN